MADLEYRRLTRAKNRSLFGVVSTSRSSLWLGKNHLLQIDTNGYTESYKRFYFRDIQALVFCQTDSWLYLAVCLAALASMFGVIALFQSDAIAQGIFGGIAGVPGFFLVLDLLAGPTCKAYLRTAVQIELLVSLNRLRRARKIFGQLRPLIASAQQQPTSSERATAEQEPGPVDPAVNLREQDQTQSFQA